MPAAIAPEDTTLKPYDQRLDSGTGDQDRLGVTFARLVTFNILANLTVPLASLVDLAMLGHLDDIRHLAGVALGGVVFDYVYWNLGVLRMATTGLTAQAVGRQDHAESSRVLARAALAGGIFGLVLVVAQTPLALAAFGLLGGSAEVEASGRAYFDARIWGAPATLINLALLGWFLGRAEGRVVLLMTAIGNLANLGLDYLFIIRWDMEAHGAGLATALSQYLTLAVAAALLLGRHTRMGGWRRVFDPDATRAMLRLSGDITVRTVCLTSVFALFTNWSAWLGTGVLAANAILLRVVSTAAYLVDGAAFATETLAGMAQGRAHRGALRRLLRLSLITGVAFELAVALAVVAAPFALLGLLTSHQDVVARAAADRWWLLPVMLPAAFAYIYDGFFLGLTAGRVLRDTMLVSLAIFALPAWLAARTGSNTGLWLALAIFMAARSWLLYRATRWYLRRDGAIADT